jgi:hypothetical protein
VKEAFHDVHKHKDGNGSRSKYGEGDRETDHRSRPGVTFGTRKRAFVGLLVEHFSKLRVRERKGPKSEVGGGIRDGAERELNGFNELMDEELAHRVLPLFASFCLQNFRNLLLDVFSLGGTVILWLAG